MKKLILAVCLCVAVFPALMISATAKGGSGSGHGSVSSHATVSEGHTSHLSESTESVGHVTEEETPATGSAIRTWVMPHSSQMPQAASSSVSSDSMSEYREEESQHTALILFVSMLGIFSFAVLLGLIVRHS